MLSEKAEDQVYLINLPSTFSQNSVLIFFSKKVKMVIVPSFTKKKKKCMGFETIISLNVQRFCFSMHGADFAPSLTALFQSLHRPPKCLKCHKIT